MKTTVKSSIKRRMGWMIAISGRTRRPMRLIPEIFAINGIDDVGERETTPPYDKPLRGMQVLIRTYEHDSRAIRQVRVNQHFMAE